MSIKDMGGNSMEEMFIGTNANGIVIGGASILSKAAPKDVESRDMIVEQMVSAAEATPYVEPVETADASVMISATEPELCM